MLDHASIVRVHLRSTNVKYSYAPDESSHSRSQHAEPVSNAGGRMYGRTVKAMPLSDLGMARTRRRVPGLELLNNHCTVTLKVD